MCQSFQTDNWLLKNKTLSNKIEDDFRSTTPFAIDWQCFQPDPSSHYEDIDEFTKKQKHF
jgi:hypothetical protein